MTIPKRLPKSEKRKFCGISRGGWVFILGTLILIVVDSRMYFSDILTMSIKESLIKDKIPMLDDSVYRSEINKFVIQYCNLTIVASLTATGRKEDVDVDGETYWRVKAATYKELNIKTLENLLPMVRGRSDGFREQAYHLYQRKCDRQVRDHYG